MVEVPPVDLCDFDEMFKDPDLVFHGTRCPRDVIEKEGIEYDKEFLIQKTKDFCVDLGVDFDIWSLAKAPFPSGGSIMSRLTGSRSPGRCQIFVTNRFEHALSYATRNPEILWYAIRSIIHFKYPRRWSAKFYSEMEETIVRLLSVIGVPKVVVINAKHPSIGGLARTNQTTKSGLVPPDAIVEIKEFPEVT